MPNDDYLLGYLTYYMSPQHTYYGGLLVTDVRGVPREFRHSEAIKPNRTQTLLYGDSLEASLGADALAPALYDALTLKPTILLMDKGSRLLFGSFLLRYPPCALLVSLTDRDLAFNDIIAPEGNLLAAKDFDLKGTPTERVYAYIEDRPPHYVGETALEVAQKYMNLMSPFDRIRQVLMEVWQVEQTRTRK